MKNGSVITGIEVDEDDKNIEVSISAFAADVTSKVRKDRLESVELSKVSPMPAGLVNRLNELEITDLIAYMLSGGNQKKMKK